MRISVVGLGKLGAPLAAVLAGAGHDVVGADISRDVVAAVNAGRSPVPEPGLAELMAANRSRLRATIDVQAAARDTELTFIIVPTPSEPSGAFSNRLLLEAIAAVGEGVTHKPDYHVVVVTSTVMPMSMDAEVRPAVERASGRVVGETIGLCYNPEFIALGSVIRDMTHPDLLLIGESDRRAGEVLEAVHRTFISPATEVRRMSFINAEIAKIAVNTFVTTKISYANMLAELCERVPGGDVDVVTGTIGIDRRIGHRFLKGAVGYGGPCFPRDNAAFAAAASQVGAHAELAIATDAVNRRQVDRLAEIVRARLAPGGRIGVLGLSYKPDTPVVEESQGLMLANRLAAGGFEVAVFDPAALQEASQSLASSIVVADTLAACVDAADMIVLAVPWPEFQQVPALLRAAPRAGRIVLDCWRALDPASLADVAELVYVGKATSDRVAAYASSTEKHRRS